MRAKAEKGQARELAQFIQASPNRIVILACRFHYLFMLWYIHSKECQRCFDPFAPVFNVIISSCRNVSVSSNLLLFARKKIFIESKMHIILILYFSFD